MTPTQKQQAREQYREKQKRERQREKLTRFICRPCREANRTGSTTSGDTTHAGHL